MRYIHLLLLTPYYSYFEEGESTPSRAGALLPHSTPLRNRSGAVFLFCRLGREMPMSQSWFQTVEYGNKGKGERDRTSTQEQDGHGHGRGRGRGRGRGACARGPLADGRREFREPGF